ncbi:hypothetical protein F5X68DRAFT_191904 [Plectosphaerella plurivora]|uniref:DUF4267 domain-containing protein n=1 Tax=Plectosphaerella plurivora TaxID=936078 RepID=A0A9P8VAR7_9PEZI|nr:hypothetical protein F5X68DRAFT_191904 [Plectosphaerella plurivora]
MSHPLFHNASLALSIMTLLFGLNAMTRPADHLHRLGFPAHTEPRARDLNLALMRIWGIRSICVGSLLILIWNTGDERLMGMALSADIALPVTDGFVSRLLTGSGAATHWSLVPVVAVVMSGLLGVFG